MNSPSYIHHHGSSHQTGGHIRGNACGNTYNMADYSFTSSGHPPH